MVMKKLNIRLLRLMNHSKGQSIAIISVIVIGLLIYTAMSMAAINLEDTINYYYKANHFADLYIQVVKIPKKAVEKINGKFGITLAQGRIVNDVPLKIKDGKERVYVRTISIPDHDFKLNDLYLVEGSPLTNKSKDAYIIEQFAKARNIQVGDTIKPQILGKEYPLKVKGIVASPEYVYLMENEQSLLPQPEKFGVLYISDELARQSFGFGSSYNEIVLQAKNENHLDQIKERLEKELDPYGVKRIIIKDDQLSNRMLSEEIKQLKNTSKTIPVLFLGVASVILAVMISRMVRNDRASIGVLKALGYNNIQIISHYTKYSLIIGVLGAIIGTSVGMFFSKLLTNMYIKFYNIPMLKATFHIKYILLAVLLSSIFCIISGLYGSMRILKIFPATAMQPEPPASGRRIFLEKIDFFWKRISFSWKIVLRNILRSKKRFIFITLGLSLSFSMLFLTVYQQNAFFDIFNNHYGEFLRFDYSINFDQPLNQSVVKEFKHIIKIEAIEPKSEFPFEIIHGHKKKVVTIVGLTKNTQFYKFINLKDKKITLPSKGILLSEGLANYLGVKKGEFIEINSFIPYRENVSMKVKGIIKQSLGMNAYLSINRMNKELLDDELATGVLIHSKDPIKEKLEDIKNISSLQSLQDLVDTFLDLLELSKASIGIMVIFSGILGFAIIYNTTIMSISERKLEFSSLRVMGFSRKEIYLILLKENFIMTLFGILLGIPIGHWMIRGVEKAFSNELFTLHSKITGNTYMTAIFLTIFFVFLAQLFTLRKIYKLDFLEALKSRIS
jgi:putative ABC transport system permease protein